MRRTLALIGAVACLAAAPALAQNAATDTTETYDLLFKDGTLDEVPDESTLIYDRTVANRAKAEAAERDTGRIALSFEQREDTEIANLMFLQDGKHRNLGSFPASVGNPMIMYFYEAVVRDMAETAGGSPFYIRNRMKDALTVPGEVIDGIATWQGEDIETQTVTLRPFEGDPNRAQMSGFGDLALTVTMSEEVPGWYLSLSAEAPHPDGGDPIYRSEMRLDGIENTAAEAAQ